MNLFCFALFLTSIPLFYAAKSPPPPTRSKRLRKRTGVESDETEEPAVVPTETFETDNELREAFEAVEHEKGQQEEEDVPLKKKGKEPEEGVRPFYLLCEFLYWSFLLSDFCPSFNLKVC